MAQEYVLRPSMKRIILPQLIELVIGIFVMYFIAMYVIGKIQGAGTMTRMLVVSILIAASILQVLVTYIGSASISYSLTYDRLEITGRKPRVIMLSQARNITLKRNFMDSLFGTGTIMIDDARIKSIANAQQWFDYLQKLQKPISGQQGI